MKLSVSAYRAHASAHKKILDTAYQLNYGSTQTQASTTTQPHFKVEPLSTEDPHPLLGPSVGASSHLAPDSLSDTPATSPRSPLNTSREEDDEDDSRSDCKSPRERYNADGNKAASSTGSVQSLAEVTSKAASQSWKNIRAVMAYYNSLRKIKRSYLVEQILTELLNKRYRTTAESSFDNIKYKLVNNLKTTSAGNSLDINYYLERTKSNQRWMKLRTTVQISSAIQKKPPLKREDSFLKRFSTRQIPETQETVEDTSSECGGNHQTVTRRRRRLAKHPRTVVNPDENFYFYWLLALTICVLYNMWALIVRQSFPELQSVAANFWLVCDAISDVVFLFDVGVQLRTGYLEQGLMVYDSKKLAGHYLHSRAFLLDLGALCPLDLLQVRFGAQPMLRFPRFLKVYRAVNYYYMVESRTVWPNLWRVVNLIHILLILAHWFGCFYFLLSEAEGFQGDWVYPYRPGDYATLTRKYLGSLYWSTLTLTTIGDLPTPETNAEQTVVSVDGPRSLPRRGLKSRLLQFNTNGGYVFTIVSYLIGVFIFATIVGQVGNVITNRNANRLEFERLLDGAKMYMRHHKVPSGMKKRVLRWYDYSWSRGRIQGGGDINTALGLLPDKLKTELALHVNLSVLKKVTIFQECQPEFLHDLVLKMKAYIFTPGDSICRKGEVAREMFIIADGILEVLSEAGRVLTTMKAGDFFGEIGILNLDGLNKRTADVRSVGYSELFSLSREDVLAAMKDYPEAQEILQALGRKRLMEVRNSARQSSRTSSKHHKDKEKQADQCAIQVGSPDHNRPLFSKLKSEAKGLRNALRKSRARRSDESLELQPLHGGPSPPKHPLKRMPRVRSDEQDNDEPETTVSPLGAGLPLLSRLRLLKEKQDNEDRITSPGNVVSPPGSAGLQPEVTTESAQTHESEVIGAGLPLLQRLLLLKAKEDTRDKPQPAPVNSGPNSGGDKLSRTPSPALSPSQKNIPGKVSFRDRIFSVRASTSSLDQKPLPFDPQSSAPDVVRDTREIQNIQSGNSTSDVQKLLESGQSCENDPWSKLQAAIVKDNSTIEEEKEKKKPNLLKLQSKTKFYESVDDLSPEYCGLPFVKKLKILNERQKLAELESAMKTRSVSLDIPDNLPYDDPSLTRSHSEASAMHKKNNNKLSIESCQAPTSPESNETPERRNLKSILKKLSEDVRPAKSGKEENRSELMRAPTIEGYAARHKSLSKSVTFDRETTSPPGAPPPPGMPPGPGGVPLMPPPTASPLIPGAGPVLVRETSPEIMEAEDDEDGKQGNVIREEKEEEMEKEEEGVKEGKEEKKEENTAQKVVKSIDEHEYFGTALLAIKQVISAHLQEMQLKFQARFDRLEAEVRSRDAVIGRLRQHIQDLERSFDEEYTVSGSDTQSTIIPRSSWDSHSNQESLELQELPESMRPHRSWHASDDVVLELDSTDTDEPEMEPSLHAATWELELLAAQMRRQTRSHSFDQAAPRRRLLCRGYSADHKD